MDDWLRFIMKNEVEIQQIGAECAPILYHVARQSDNREEFNDRAWNALDLKRRSIFQRLVGLMERGIESGLLVEDLRYEEEHIYLAIQIGCLRIISDHADNGRINGHRYSWIRRTIEPWSERITENLISVMENEHLLSVVENNNLFD